MNKQRSYISFPEGFFVALFAAGIAAVIVVGVLIGVALAFGQP